MLNWTKRNPQADYFLGLIQQFLSDKDERSAREQFNSNYAHGGGWNPLSGWTREGACICYPGDTWLNPVAEAKLREEIIFVYPNAWVMILQPNGDFEVARMD